MDELAHTIKVKEGESAQGSPEFRVVDAHIGSTVANYRITGLIGRGAMGSVYKAEHLMLEKEAAIKILHPHLCADEQAIKRFKQEAQSASRLNHTGIVRVDDFGVTPEGLPYLCMDYIKGQSLSELIAEGPLPVERALSLCAQICDALAEAHRKGVVHRDIKPSNVIVLNPGTENEHIKVVDFGIAKVVEDSKGLALTQTGESIGSPPYMSPEQCQARQLDARSDVYSLGCVLYEMLTGQSPFHSDSIYQIIHKHLHANPEPIGKVKEGIPYAIALDALLLGALAKDPSKRYRSATGFRMAIREAEMRMQAPGNLISKLKLWAQVQGSRVNAQQVLIMGALLVLTTVPLAGLVYMVSKPAPPVSAPIAPPMLASSGDFEALHREAVQLMHEKQCPLAIGKFRQALKAGRTLGLENPDVQNCMKGMANCLAEGGNQPEAKRLNDQLATLARFSGDRGNVLNNSNLIAQLTAAHTQHPHDQAVKAQLISTLNAQAKLFSGTGEFDGAKSCASSVLSLADPQADRAQYVQALKIVAGINTEEFNFNTAKKQGDQLLKLAHAAGAVSDETAEAYMAWAHYHAKLSAYMKGQNDQDRAQHAAQALDWYDKAANVWQQLYGAQSPYLADCLLGKGAALRNAARWSDSENTIRKGLEMCEQLRGLNDPRTATAYYALGFTTLYHGFEVKDKNPKEAAILIQDADRLLSISMQTMGQAGTDSSVLRPSIYVLRGRALQYLKNYTAAEDFYNRALAESIKIKSQSDTAKLAYKYLIEIYTEQGRTQDIHALMNRVKSAAGS